MKLFYHFLIFVFVSLVLVVCARIFTTDSENETAKNGSPVLKRDSINQIDYFITATFENSPYK
jgi:hypothetical protein